MEMVASTEDVVQLSENNFSQLLTMEEDLKGMRSQTTLAQTGLPIVPKHLLAHRCQPPRTFHRPESWSLYRHSKSISHLVQVGKTRQAGWSTGTGLYPGVRDLARDIRHSKTSNDPT